ncbi:MAG TPA: hypothetical protein VNP04_13675 [Alphaproteobacteria bacterium]|nr:hypothetical protein [Alphaproteobacteria bacterium]
MISAVISAPANFMHPGGRVTVCITNPASTVPLHVGARVVWEGVDGSSNVSPLVAYVLSSTQPFGGSNAEAHFNMLILSGLDAAITYGQIVGSAIQVVIMPACALSATVGVSGLISIWLT